MPAHAREKRVLFALHLSVCLSVCLSARPSAPNARTFVKNYVGEFIKICRPKYNLVTVWLSEERSSLIGTGFPSFAFKHLRKI